MGKSNNTFNDEKSFKEFSEEWLEYIRSFHKPSTHIKYRNIIYRYFLPVLGDSDSRAITNVSVEDIVSHVWDGEAGSPSQSTVRSVRSVYQSIAKYCDIDINPQMLRWQTLNNITTNKKHISTFSSKQQRQLVNYLLTDSDKFKVGIILCLYSGLRIGEICALQTDDILLKEKKINVTRTVQRLSTSYESLDNRTNLVESPPKTPSSCREIPMCNFLCSILPPYITDSKYFLGEDKPIDPRRYQYKFKKYQEKLGFNVLNFHTLRHTFATNCISGGMDPKTLSVILGHSDVKTTLNRYVHPSDDFKLRQLNKCVKHFPVSEAVQMNTN